MATKKDLIEAHSFTRRRLVTAFLSGAPGGREVEPSRPGRTVVGGVALSVLLVAGAAIASVLSPRTEANWQDPGLIISKETGERYVITDNTEGDPDLRPVINVTSAQLILGVDVQPKIIKQEVLDGVTPGADIGILGAPQQLPSEEEFLNSGWTACVHGQDNGLRVHIPEEPTARTTPRAGFLVTTGQDDYWVIAQALPADGTSTTPRAYRYPVSAGANRDNLLRNLNLPTSQDAMVVPREWLDLFPDGKPLARETFAVSGAGRPVTAAGAQPGAKVGDLLKTDDGGFLVYATPGGQLWNLTDFEAVVYEHTANPTVLTGPAPAGDQDNPPSRSADWPDRILSDDRVVGEYCAVLRAENGERPHVVMATDPAEDEEAGDVKPGERLVTIAPGHGALVKSGDWTQATSSTTFVVDNNAKAYALQGKLTLERLEYAALKVPLVPDTWIKVLNEGVVLSTELALCPPVFEAGSECE